MIILRKISQQQLSECIGLGEDLLTVSGSNQLFNTQNEYVSGTVTVFYNGQALYAPHDFIEIPPTGIQFTYITPNLIPGFEDEDVLKVAYKYADCSGLSSSATTKKGKAVIGNGNDSVSVNFGEAFSNTNYIVTTNLVNGVDSQPNVYPYIVGPKTTSGFTVYFQDTIDSNNYYLEWIAMAL